MSDNEVTQMWVDLRSFRADKRARNREFSTEMLIAAGFAYESKNHGAHLRVEKNVDFWPGTGLWKDLAAKRSGRGIRQLIKYLEGRKP